MRSKRAALALAAVPAVCLGAVAYAAVPKHTTPPASAAKRPGAALPRPSLTLHPDNPAVSDSARFAFRSRLRKARFRCRLDGRAWRSCRSPVTYSGLAPGAHSFAVRVARRGGRRARAARFHWRVLTPMGFKIEQQPAGLDPLYPGAAPQPLRVTVVNPNPVPIFVTGLRATATSGPLGCSPAENLVLIEAGATSATPLEVPGGGSASLPAAGIAAPAIQLRDLAVSQDACKNGRFELAFSGEARG